MKKLKVSSQEAAILLGKESHLIKQGDTFNWNSSAYKVEGLENDGVLLRRTAEFETDLTESKYRHDYPGGFSELDYFGGPQPNLSSNPELDRGSVSIELQSEQDAATDQEVIKWLAEIYGVAPEQAADDFNALTDKRKQDMRADYRKHIQAPSAPVEEVTSSTDVSPTDYPGTTVMEKKDVFPEEVKAPRPGGPINNPQRKEQEVIDHSLYGGLLHEKAALNEKQQDDVDDAIANCLRKPEQQDIAVADLLDYVVSTVTFPWSDEIEAYALSQIERKLGRTSSKDNGPSDEDVQALAWEKYKKHWNALGTKEQDAIYKELGYDEEKQAGMATEELPPTQGELEEAFRYLDELRESGQTNMYGAAPFVAEEFMLDKGTARKILSLWMQTFGDGKTDAPVRTEQAIKMWKESSLKTAATVQTEWSIGSPSTTVSFKAGTEVEVTAGRYKGKTGKVIADSSKEKGLNFIEVKLPTGELIGISKHCVKKASKDKVTGPKGHPFNRWIVDEKASIEVGEDDVVKLVKTSKRQASSITRAAQTDAQEEALSAIEGVFKAHKIPLSFGTTIGKAPQTVILDVKYQGSEIRVNADGEAEIFGTKIIDVDDYEIEQALRGHVEMKSVNEEDVPEKEAGSQPGKFEAEPEYTEYFWNLGMGGGYDELVEEGFKFFISKEDIQKFPELLPYESIEVVTDDNGFVNHTLVAKHGYDVSRPYNPKSSLKTTAHCFKEEDIVEDIESPKLGKGVVALVNDKGVVAVQFGDVKKSYDDKSAHTVLRKASLKTKAEGDAMNTYKQGNLEREASNFEESLKKSASEPAVSTLSFNALEGIKDLSVVMLGCGEPFGEWGPGIANLLKEKKMVKADADPVFKTIAKIEGNVLGDKGRTDLLFVFDPNCGLDLSRFPIFKIGTFGGDMSWTEDFIANHGEDYGATSREEGDVDASLKSKAGIDEPDLVNTMEELEQLSVIMGFESAQDFLDKTGVGFEEDIKGKPFEMVHNRIFIKENYKGPTNNAKNNFDYGNTNKASLKPKAKVRAKMTLASASPEGYVVTCNGKEQLFDTAPAVLRLAKAFGYKGNADLNGAECFLNVQTGKAIVDPGFFAIAKDEEEESNMGAEDKELYKDWKFGDRVTLKADEDEKTKGTFLEIQDSKPGDDIDFLIYWDEAYNKEGDHIVEVLPTDIGKLKEEATEEQLKLAEDAYNDYKADMEQHEEKFKGKVEEIIEQEEAGADDEGQGNMFSPEPKQF